MLLCLQTNDLPDIQYVSVIVFADISCLNICKEKGKTAYQLCQTQSVNFLANLHELPCVNYK
jgi:hypothetical protein